jgi:hypothetical protein
MPLQGTAPEVVFRKFKEHLNALLHQTITQAPLVQIVLAGRTFLEFRQQGTSVAVPVGRGYHLYLAQTLEATKTKEREYTLKTLAYAYRIADGPDLNARWLIRWEYNSREQQSVLHPRHHCHLPAEIVFGKYKLNFDKLHVASGWVTIEEVIRFLIHELGVTPRSRDWDRRLRASEEKFRIWTNRSM